METLPTHVAADDEPIASLSGRDLDGPDMRMVMPVVDMLADLRQFGDDEVGYVERWRQHVTSMGGSISVLYERGGERCLMVGSCCDGQIRHRSRWLHFLCADLNDDERRREYLIRSLIDERCYADNRPANPRATTTAMRDYLRTGGRILIDPKDRLMDGSGLPRLFFEGADEDTADVIRAAKAYSEVRLRWRSERHIKRAVRMLGSPTENGWLVLEARS